MTDRFENAKVGDRVYSKAHGWGKIIGIDTPGLRYPIEVETDNNCELVYTRDGYYWDDKSDDESENFGRFKLYWTEQEYLNAKDGIITTPEPDYEAEFKEHLKDKAND